MSPTPHTTVPGLAPDEASRVVDVLADRLVASLDLQLTLKHIHWNVVGAGFLSVHEMPDEQVEPVRAMTDALAERIRTLGGTPQGTPAAIVAGRSWDDYAVGTAPVATHLLQLDRAYSGVIADHRGAIADVGPIDPVSEDLLIGHTAQLELFQWFIRSFLESSGTEAAPVDAEAPAFGVADRPPTDAESADAERAADRVDVDAVRGPYREMAAIGADVDGEGAI